MISPNLQHAVVKDSAALERALLEAAARIDRAERQREQLHHDRIHEENRADEAEERAERAERALDYVLRELERLRKICDQPSHNCP